MAKNEKKTSTLLLIDRVNINGLYKSKGKYETLIIWDDIREKVQMSQEELKKFEVKTVATPLPDGQTAIRTVWSDEAAKQEFEVAFTESERNEIKETLRTLSEEGSLTQDIKRLYKLFVADAT